MWQDEFETFLVTTSIFCILMCISTTFGQQLDYPKTRKIDHIDTYHGVKIADPYRWLEDDNSAETAKWVEAENKVTFGYLERIPYRNQVKARLERLYDYPKYSAPSQHEENFFFSKNDGLQNQDVVYMQKGLDGKPEVLLDPNKLSADGTSRLMSMALSKDAKLLAYDVSKGGSDWREVFVMDVATRQVLPDRLQWIKASGLAWAANGFFYSRYPSPSDGHSLSAKNEFHKVYFHRIGTPQEQDELIYDDPANPQRFHNIRTTEDERFAILYISDRGKGNDGNSVYYRDLTKRGDGFHPIVSEIANDSYGVIENIGGKFLIETNHHAPNRKVALFDPANPGSPWKEIVPEKPEPMKSARTGGGKLFVTYMKDVATHAYVYSLDGKFESEIKLPGNGNAHGFEGRADAKQIFYEFTSLNVPDTIYRYSIADGKSEVFRTPDIPGYNSTSYESKQVFYTSKDGTRVPMFLVYKKGLQLNGKNPTLLYAYGGFNITTNPTFVSTRLALLEQGFIYASANIRGGAEYGEKWHVAGTKLQKQNVFDDFIAAAEYLIAAKYTSPEKLAIQGGSNGGLLVGAAINQRPELFRAAIAQVGVMDMLRFHKFTIGWNWAADYGSSDNEAEFKALRAYSPLHNIKEGVKYPATLITTADHDDRVVPAHSFKYAATLQEKASPENPVLIRIGVKSGHGASSTAKKLEELADVYSFLFQCLGVTPKY
jgi:prolyl oligopeptidase